MRDKVEYIETEKKKYPICFNLNVLEKIQEAYGSLDKWIETVDSANDLPKIKDLKKGILEMINEAIDMENEFKNENEPFLNEKQVGRILTEIGLEKITETIVSIAVNSTKSDEEEKNV